MNGHPNEQLGGESRRYTVRGFSLVETLVSVVVLATTAMMYAGVFNSQVSQHYSLEETAIATDLYIRQVELLRQMDLRNPGAATYTETNIATGCPQPHLLEDPAGGLIFPYAAARSPSNQLDPPVSPTDLLTSLNSYLLPANSPFVLQLPAALMDAASDRVFSLSVRANRVRASATFARESTLIKFCVRVDFTTQGFTRNIITGEFFREIVMPL